MGRNREEAKPDRFLVQRAGLYHYKRRVPKEVGTLDRRFPMVRLSLKTSSLGKAMALRDIHERADNEFWASLLVGSDQDVAQRRYKATVARAAALGLTYRSAADIAHELPVTIVDRIDKAIAAPKDSVERDAAVGMAKGGGDMISAAFETYVATIARDEIRFKSEAQKKTWKVRKKASVTAFVDINGDKAMAEITRDDALKVHAALLARVAPAKGRATLSANMANRQLGNLRVFYRDWFTFYGQKDRQNPFDSLSFTEGAQKPRPPFAVEWIKDKFLTAGKLKAMNAEARGVLLAMVETGCRLSEICNLTADNIVLNADVPHILIAPSDDPDGPREIKTATSIRAVPLVGVSLAVFRKHKKGFPRYLDKGNALSATINKFLRENELLPTESHSAYCLRHSFEDRMKAADISDDMRRELMGHAIDRPKYGEGYSLAAKQAALTKMVLPYDQRAV